MFGKLSLELIPTNPIIVTTVIVMAIITIVVLGGVTIFRKWGYLWQHWLTSVDHKKIGIMYIIASAIMLLRGIADAIMMRLQQSISTGPGTGFLEPEHYNQIFTAHGVIMIFFVAMPFMFGLFNMVVPLQIGARDVAFPFYNALSFWLFVVGCILVNLSLALGDFAQTGWLAYPPLSELAGSPDVGVDYYIWALQIAGIGSLLSGINFFVTIIKMRVKGMTMMRMPIFVWSVLCSAIMICLAFPILTATLGMLFLDRYFGMHFFTADFAGNQMLYVNLIWAWGHPEVYILVLPAFGVFSEVVATFSRKRLFGYYTMVFALVAITFLSFIVWVHHFFTMGAGANVNAFFGIATMIIGIPTGVKVFNWLFTMYKGKITMSGSMYWTVAFLLTFTVGGMTGVILSVPAIDYQVHNTLFLIAHFHNVIVGGVLFGYFAGFVYWFPKVFGFKLNECLGKIATVFWVIGFMLAFIPIYILGFMGMPRRLSYYDPATGWKPYLIVALVGTLIIVIGVLFQILQVLVSVIHRKKLKAGNDPWNARTLEWSIPSPAPSFNFPVDPIVDSYDQFWEDKQNGKVQNPGQIQYRDIHMPKSTGIPIIIAGFWLVIGFALIFHINWLAIIGLIGVIISFIVRSFDYDRDYYIKAEEVKREFEQGGVNNG